LDIAASGGQHDHRPALLFSILMAAIADAGATPALPQACTREGDAVTCDDGRPGLRSDEIIWPDGARSSLSPHPSVIIGNKSSVRVGPGVFVGQGKALCRWTIRTRRTRRAAPSSMTCRIAISTGSSS
jgi:hypothetical protein